MSHKKSPSEALADAVEVAGGQVELAKKLSELMGRPVFQQHIWNWLNRDHVLPGEYAIPIERAVERKVTRYDLRPDLYPHETAA